MNTLVFWLIAHWPWFKNWFGEGTPDDFKNPFWRITEGPLAAKVLWAYTILDFRFVYHNKSGEWMLLDLALPYKTKQNFWNGFFTVQVYIVAWKWFIWPKVNIVFRPLRDWWMEISTPGLLFDRGVIHAKFAIMNWQKEGKIDAYSWDEGSV